MGFRGRQRSSVLLIGCFLTFLWFHKSPLPSEALIALHDNFPSASSRLHNTTWTPPHVREGTPLFIGFSHNWLILQQCVVSYIAAGWPPSDIYVFDNTGVMFANQRRELSIDNPSFLDYYRLEEIFGVNVIITSALLTFSQLQNLFLFEAANRNWEYFFWSHADAVALSADVDGAKRSLYLEAVMDMRAGLQGRSDWAIRFYAYDRLALVSVNALVAVGGWDTRIPFYPSDCDMYERLAMAGCQNPSPFIGHIYDVASTIDNLDAFYTAGVVGSPEYVELNNTLLAMMEKKNTPDQDRNTWQGQQRGGNGESFYYPWVGAQRSRTEMISLGRKIYKMKWGTKECRLKMKWVAFPGCLEEKALVGRKIKGERRASSAISTSLLGGFSQAAVIFILTMSHGCIQWFCKQFTPFLMCMQRLVFRCTGEE